MQQEFVATVEGRVMDCIQVRAGMGEDRVECRVRCEGRVGGKGEAVPAVTIEGR